MVDEIGSSTLMECDFSLVKGPQITTEQGTRTPFPLFLILPISLLLMQCCKINPG